MSKFTSDDMGWTIRYASADGDKDFGYEWREFFGDEYNWTSLLPLAWAAVGGPEARINAPKLGGENEIFRLTSWWNTPLHLLAFGLGWTNIGTGLKRWREGGYQTENEILKLIYNTYGPSIEALEVWCSWSSSNYSFGSELVRLGNRAGVRDVHSGTQPDELKRQLERLMNRLNSGPRHKLIEPLINTQGGYDPFHLIGHFGGSIAQMLQLEAQDSPPILADFTHVRAHNEKRILVLDSYAGWYGHLLGAWNADNSLGQSRGRDLIQVEVVGLGSLGTFTPNKESGLPYRLNANPIGELPTTGEILQQLRWHLLGI